MKNIKVIKIKDEKWERIYIDGTKTNYKVSNYGRVKNSKRNKLLKPWMCPSGYNEVTIRCKGVSHPKLVHRLVAEYFVKGYSDKRNIVNHKNGKKLFNYYYNLEWVTAKENVHHAINTGLQSNITTEQRITQNKVEPEQVHLICKLLEYGYSNKDIADSFSVNKMIVWHIATRNTWTHISKDYNFKTHVKRSYGDKKVS